MTVDKHVAAEVAVAPIVAQVRVSAPPATVFEAFTARMERWWDPGHSIGAQPFTRIGLEPEVGGRWYERDAAGVECDWGRVLAWEPPSRVLLTWQIGADWTYDPALVTQVEVTFTPADGGGTLVRLEHRGLESYGAAAAEMSATYGSAHGWAGLLERLGARLGA
ncbi:MULTISPECIES: SRPBCC family protein [unclassified Actinotalea]|uniref:SRPBCC family protein n=1 Tax=unclassified Actinotalea TaxID=2638618 RepID=UPI0015F5A575|nr:MULTISPECIES: SRPBCC family protein [unclassified Actinotalea]